MEIPIQVAVRTFAGYPNEETIIKSIPATTILPIDYLQQPPTTQEHLSTTGVASGITQKPTAGIIQINGHSFPVAHALPMNCTQNQIYQQTVYPLIGMFLEGFDASFVTYGQRGTGKTYTMLGPGFECVYGEAEQGIIQRCVRDIFAQLTHQRERNYVINIGWVEVMDDEILDLLDNSGNVPCISVSDVFHWLQIGLNNRSTEPVHSIFTLTLEQQWVTSGEGLIQHRLSTASFCDLCATDRMLVVNSIDQHMSVPKDLGLQALERVVESLANPNLHFNNATAIQYNQSTLTTLLKDSFGGRAQTLLILCVSPLEEDTLESIDNLNFAFKAQCVRNFVVLNTYSDNNTPLIPIDGGGEHSHTDNAGLQFAASQWLKLVSNAEGLFSKLIANKSLNEQDRERIEEWMFLKQECEECLSSGELNMVNARHLGPIQEEQDETSDQETSCQQNTDNESDTDSHHSDLEDKISGLMEEFREKTDQLIKEKYDDFVRSHPKAVLDSNDSFSPTDERRPSSPRGRRKSIQPGSLSLSSIEIAMLNRVATREQMSGCNKSDDFLDSSSEHLPLRSAAADPQEIIQNKLRKVDTDLDAAQRQIKELENTVAMKQKLISDLIKNNDTRTTAKQRFNKKKSKLEAEYEKTKKQLTKAVVNGRDKAEIERLKLLTSHIEQRLQDLVSIKHIAGESGQKVKQHQQSLQVSKKQLEVLYKSAKKNKKIKEALETELKNEKLKLTKAQVATPDKSTKTIRDVTARISHLDHVLKEKSQNLKDVSDGDEKESLRHEIRNLRRTRDHLLDQRCMLDRKLKKEKKLSHKEERKLLECDEAIEAIDAAIEFKNELICGRKSVDTNERLQREKGEKMLMARLNNLSLEEMRTLLYKYFQKVIDLRDSSRKLEVQLMQLERERDAWEWRERVLNNAIRQARLEGESHAVLLQQQQEAKVALMLRHLAEETSVSSSLTDRMVTATTNQPGDNNDLELDVYKQGGASSKQLIKSRHGDMDLCPIPVEGRQYKYKPLDKMKEKDRESKNKLFAKFQVLARYHSGSGSAAAGTGSDKRKVHDSSMSIPEQNLRQLQQATPLTVAKVTREKNKIIIQQDATRRH